MPNSNIDSKIIDLESRLAFQEDLLAAMNKRVSDQDQEIAKLQLQLKHLNEKITAASEEAGSLSAVDQKPPHY